ncbi:MAG TPA: endonuclease/exonuclease/phosphatase family protein [Jatrophihabitantaceae bacterium]|nr:endonuclease/exonuclease/phosphatase family protein [Jatrophihabitantaceae bacterium]
MPTLRVLTYNVRSMRDDRAALGRVLRDGDPDVVLVQESPRFARWRSLCAQLARLGNLVVVSGGRYAGSNLILSSLSVAVESSVDVLFTRDPMQHRRGAAIAVMSKQGARFAVAGTHLDLHAAPRLRHVAELDAAIGQHVPADVPTIVAGDINDEPGSPAWRALTGHRTDALAAVGAAGSFTSPARGAFKTIDGVFVDPRIAVTSARVLASPDVLIASDHRPVLVELEF